MKPIDSLTDDDFAELVQRAAQLPDAPPAVLRAAIELWPRAQPAVRNSLGETLGHIIHAVLSFDSWARPTVAFGMRSAVSDTRQLLFSANGRDVDLRINHAADTFSLTGQVLGPDESGTVELAADTRSVDSGAESADSYSDDGKTLINSRVASLDELGEFRLDNIGAGTYRLTLRMGGDEIVLPPIIVGEQPA